MKDLKEYKSYLSRASEMPEVASRIDSYASALSTIGIIIAVLDFFGILITYWEDLGLVSLFIAFVTAFLFLGTIYLPALILKGVANIIHSTHRNAEFTKIQNIIILDYIIDQQNSSKPSAPSYNDNLPTL